MTPAISGRRTPAVRGSEFAATAGTAVRTPRYSMEHSDPNVRHSVKLKSPWDHSAAWARVMVDGRIELELYDFSEEAQSHMGNDVAWIWIVAAADKPRVLELLQEQAAGLISDDVALLDALARHFAHVHAIRDWLREKQIPLEEKFDSWA